MKRALIATAALAFGVFQAQAADLAVRPAPVQEAYVAPFTWTGLYSGFHVGYGWGNTRGRVDALNLNDVPNMPKPNGWFAGTSVGYNWQMSNIVLGVEADFSYGKVKGSSTIFNIPNVGSVGATSNLDYFFTVRGRLGFAMDRFLVYGTGGFAYGHNNATVNLTAANGVGVRIFDDNGHTGWTAGGGLEYAVTNDWSIKGEYLYMDLGRKNYHFIQGAPNLAANLGLRVHTAKIGLNYKFNFFGL